jgi:hypothetical protein
VSRNRKLLERYLKARFEPPVVAVGLLCYEMCMVQSLQDIEACEEWAQALHRVAETVSADYGRAPQVQGGANVKKQGP